MLLFLQGPTMLVKMCNLKWDLLQRGNKRRVGGTQDTQTYWAVVLQGDAVQGVPLLDISGQVDNVLHPLSGGASPQSLSATWPQLIDVSVLLWQVILRAIVSKQIGMTAVGRLHHGGGLEPIVLASTGHFFFTVLERAETELDYETLNSCSIFFGKTSNVYFTLREYNQKKKKNMFEMINM